MTYLVLARKWRPRSFDTLVGQDHVVRALTHALDTQRLHHAWLFTGTRGVGKTTLSRILAKSLNCENGITAQPCGQCRACTEIDAGRYVDYVELDAASNRGVEEMTQLLEQAVYAPSSARFKVYMIDEVHMLTGHAFNAMLKTLEEPPPHVKFILATTDPQKIPVTVLSRCLQFNLKHMTVDSIVEHLQSVLGQEEVAFESPALRLLGQAAGGSMRDALSLTDQAIAYSAGNLTLDAVQGMLGTIDQRHLVRLLQALAVGQADGVLAVADELAARGLSYAGALADLAVLLSRVAIQQRVPGALPADDPLAPDVEALAGALHPDLVQLYYSVAVHSRGELALAPDEYAGFVMACLRMLALTPESARLPEPPSPGRGGQPGGRDTAPSGSGIQGETGAESAQPPAQSAPAAQQAPVALNPAPAPATRSESSAPPAAVAEPAGGHHGGRNFDTDIPAWEAPPDDLAAVPEGAVESLSAVAPTEIQASAAEPAIMAEAPAETQRATAAAPAPSEPADAIGLPEAAGAVEISPPASQPEAVETTKKPVPDAAVAVDEAHEQPASTTTDAISETATAAEDGLPAEPPKGGGEGAAEPSSADDEIPGPDSPVDAASDVADQGFAPPIDFDVPDYGDGDWEPVMDDDGMDGADLAAASLTAASLGAAGLAPLPREASVAASRAPRLARMTAQEWPQLAASLRLTGLADELARQSEWVGVEGDTITLRVAIWSLAAKQGQARLRTELTEHFGKVVKLNIEFGATGAGTARAVEQVRRAERQKEAESAVASDPFVLSLIEEFGARVMPGSITALDHERAA